MRRGGLARSAGTISLATLSSRLLGLVRDVVQGAFFGTGAGADAFTVAARVPTLLRDLFAEGAMSAAFVPTLTRYLETGGRQAAFRLGAQVINGLVLVTGAVVLVAILFADPLIGYYAGPFKEIPGKFELTVTLARITMPFLMLVAVAAAFMGMLNSLRRFVVPASSPALYNTVFVACTIGFVPVFRSAGIEPTLALAAGMLLGGVAQVAMQWPSLRREGYRHEWRLNPRDPGLREVLMLMGPGAIGVAAAQVNLLVNTSLSAAEPGAPAALTYAFRMMYMPIGIIGVSVATAAIPDLARHAATKSYSEMRATLSWGVRLMLMLSVPATVGLMVLAEPIIELIYQRGEFDASSTLMTSGALLFFAPGIVGYSIVKIASPSFYSMQDARTPAVISLITIAVNLALNLWLNSVMGFRGLALGTAIAANLNAGLLLVLLSRRIDGVDGRAMARSFSKIAVASAVMGVVCAWVASGLEAAWPGADLVARLARVLGAITASVATLALTAWVLRIEEFRVAVEQFTARLRR